MKRSRQLWAATLVIGLTVAGITVAFDAARVWGLALVQGVEQGAAATARAAVHLTIHPVGTAQGIANALHAPGQIAQRTHEDLRPWIAALSKDPAGALRTAIAALVCLLAFVLVAHILDGAAERLSRHIESLTGGRGARRSGIARVNVLARARRIILERRRGETRPGISMISQRIRWLGTDVAATRHRLMSEPAAWLLFALHRVFAKCAGGALWLLRSTWRQFALFALPAALILQPWVTISVQQAIMDADPHLARAIAALRKPATDGQLPASVVQMMREAFATHRRRHVSPARDLDAWLEQNLGELDGLVSRGRIDDDAMDNRLDRLLRIFAWENLQLAETLGVQASATLVQERTLIQNAMQRSKADATRAQLEAYLNKIERQIAFEACLVSAATGDPNALLVRPFEDQHETCGSPGEPTLPTTSTPRSAGKRS